MEKIKLNIQKFASGTIPLSTSGNMTGQIVWSSVSNGTSKNSSTVYADLYVRRTNNYTTTGTFTGAINIGGLYINVSQYASVSSSWVKVGSYSREISHNNDGSGSCWIGADLYGPSGTSLSGAYCTGGATVTLDKIARYATVTDATNFTDEENPTIYFTNPANFDLRLRLSIGTDYYAIVRDKVTKKSPYTFELTEEERNLLRAKTPDSNELSVKMVVDTYIDGTIQNNSVVTRKMTIVNANPTFSNFDFEDINPTTLALTGNSKYNINGYSTIKAKISATNKATAKKSATMSKYRFTIGDLSTDINYSDTDEVSGSIEKAPNGTFNVYAIDSRNNSTLVTKLAEKAIQYTPIYIDRQNSYVTRDDGGVGGNVSLTFSGTIWNNSFGAKNNSIKSAIYRFKKTTSNEWITGTTDITPTISGNKFSFSALVRSDNDDYTFDLQSSYDFEITISDQLSSDTFRLTPLGSAIPNLALADNGVGIMGAYNEEVGGLLQVGGQRIDYNTGIFSEEETIIGTWLGKPLYKKIIDIGNLPNAQIKDVPTGLTDVVVQHIYGRAYNSTSGNTLPLPYVAGVDAYINLAFNNKNARVSTVNDRSAWTGYVVLEYTKNSD